MVVVGVLHDLSCKMFLFRFTKKKFEREARERNEASNNTSELEAKKNNFDSSSMEMVLTMNTLNSHG